MDNWQVIVPIVTSVIAATTTLVTVLWGNRLQKANELNLKLRDSLNAKKMSFYKDLLSFMGDMIDGKYDRHDDNYDDLRGMIQDKFKEAAYYASPEVIKSFGDLMQHYYTDSNPDILVLRGRKLLAELTVQIRIDLGHNASSFRKETWLDILRFSIKDIKDYIPTAKVKDRGKKTKPAMVRNKEKIK